MTESKSLEAAARALYAANPLGVYNNRVKPMVFEPYPFDDLDSAEQFHFINLTQIAIEAYLAAEKSAGRAMMPREPTPEMVELGFVPVGQFALALAMDQSLTDRPLEERAALTGKASREYASKAWLAMFDAAPSQGEAG